MSPAASRVATDGAGWDPGEGTKPRPPGDRGAAGPDGGTGPRPSGLACGEGSGCSMSAGDGATIGAGVGGTAGRGGAAWLVEQGKVSRVSSTKKSKEEEAGVGLDSAKGN